MPTDLTETGGGFDVVQAYMDHVKRIDPSLANEDFSDLISAHRRLSEQANGRTALALEGSTVLCVTEDIPFLVDSVSIAIKARSSTVNRGLQPTSRRRPTPPSSRRSTTSSATSTRRSPTGPR